MPRLLHTRFTILDAARRAGVHPDILYRDLAKGVAKSEKLCNIQGFPMAQRMTAEQIDDYRVIVDERRQAVASAAIEKASAEYRRERDHEIATKLQQARLTLARYGGNS